MDHIELDKDTITKAYARWAPVYDLVFGAVFERGRARGDSSAAERDRRPRLLEVGVGTGISAPRLQARQRSLCGVDISAPMLRKAAGAGCRSSALTNVEGLCVMDAEQLSNFRTPHSTW